MEYNVTEQHLNTEQIETYMARIGFDGALDGSVSTLSRLQQCHLHTVPYENLDILYGIPLSLDVQAVYTKIVEKGRGGYCFELNILFGTLLRSLGYQVTDLFAKVLAGHNGNTA